MSGRHKSPVPYSHTLFSLSRLCLGKCWIMCRAPVKHHRLMCVGSLKAASLMSSLCLDQHPKISSLSMPPSQVGRRTQKYLQLWFCPNRLPNIVEIKFVLLPETCNLHICVAQFEGLLRLTFSPHVLIRHPGLPSSIFSGLPPVPLELQRPGRRADSGCGLRRARHPL